jgi:hypothetical protein
MCSLAIWISSFEKVLLSSVVHFLITTCISFKLIHVYKGCFLSP